MFLDYGSKVYCTGNNVVSFILTIHTHTHTHCLGRPHAIKSHDVSRGFACMIMDK